LVKVLAKFEPKIVRMADARERTENEEQPDGTMITPTAG
jgi:hypothetical protein